SHPAPEDHGKGGPQLRRRARDGATGYGATSAKVAAARWSPGRGRRGRIQQRREEQGLRGSCERKLPLAEHLLRRLPPLHAVGVSVEATVDRNGDREEVSLVSQGIELTHGPVPGCYPESVLRHGSELRLLFEGETQRLPGGAIICAPRELDRAAAFVSPSVSWLRVAEVAPPFVGRAVSELLHIAEVKGLMP